MKRGTKMDESSDAYRVVIQIGRSVGTCDSPRSPHSTMFPRQWHCEGQSSISEWQKVTKQEHRTPMISDLRTPRGSAMFRQPTAVSLTPIHYCLNILVVLDTHKHNIQFASFMSCPEYWTIYPCHVQPGSWRYMVIKSLRSASEIWALLPTFWTIHSVKKYTGPVIGWRSHVAWIN